VLDNHVPRLQGCAARQDSEEVTRRDFSLQLATRMRALRMAELIDLIPAFQFIASSRIIRKYGVASWSCIDRRTCARSVHLPPLRSRETAKTGVAREVPDSNDSSRQRKLPLLDLSPTRVRWWKRNHRRTIAATRLSGHQVSASIFRRRTGLDWRCLSRIFWR
jgi:hypothetical protein